VKDPNDSAWARRGFQYSTRKRIYIRTVRANEPLTIPEVICRQNPNVTMEQATEAFHLWSDAAHGTLEGTAAYGRGDQELVNSEE
jgi:hypothetical protein